MNCSGNFRVISCKVLAYRKVTSHPWQNSPLTIGLIILITFSSGPSDSFHFYFFFLPLLPALCFLHPENLFVLLGMGTIPFTERFCTKILFLSDMMFPVYSLAESLIFILLSAFCSEVG